MFLEQIHNPADMKSLDDEQLIQLAEEIRAFLIDSIPKTGGHFGANLGVVELTIALHKVFDSPHDKFVWDVGHQAYVHKILTGRRGLFHTLRKYGGLSGFPRRSESIHDAFGAGHASTSISAALGLAVARDLSHDSYKVIAIIGDGALTGGMAMEALNHAGHLGKDVLVILNDNLMSIAQNVGAVSTYLTDLRTNGGTNRGGWFETFGFQYVGPVDGHDLPRLIYTLKQVKALNGPTLLHVITEKGKGYPDAENAPDKFHAWPTKSKPALAPSYTTIFADTLIELAEKDKRIVAVTAAMPNGTGLSRFANVFPQRFFDVGIAEQHATTFCGGLAAGGKRPVFAVYSTFLQRALDQVIHDICIQKLPVVFAVDRAGLVGPDGETHQGIFDIAFLRTIPNLTIMMPKDENELRNMLYTAFQLDGPSVVRYPRADGQSVPIDEKFTCLPIGHAELIQDGVDVAILALGQMVQVASGAADVLTTQYGISAKVVNLRFAKPLHKPFILELALNGMPIVILEESFRAGGVGSAVQEILADAEVQTRVLCRGIPDRFIEHGTRNDLLDEVGLNINHIVQDIRQFLNQSVSDEKDISTHINHSKMTRS